MTRGMTRGMTQGMTQGMTRGAMPTYAIQTYATLQLLVVIYVYLVGTPRAKESHDRPSNGFIFCRSLDTLTTAEILVITVLMEITGIYTAYQTLPKFSVPPYLAIVAFPLLFLLQWKSLNYSWHSYIVAAVSACNFFILYFLIKRRHFRAVATVYVLLFVTALAIFLYRAERAKQAQKWVLEVEFSFVLFACATTPPLALLFFPAKP